MSSVISKIFWIISSFDIFAFSGILSSSCEIPKFNLVSEFSVCSWGGDWELFPDEENNPKNENNDVFDEEFIIVFMFSQLNSSLILLLKFSKSFKFFLLLKGISMGKFSGDVCFRLFISIISLFGTSFISKKWKIIFFNPLMMTKISFSSNFFKSLYSFK